MTSGDAPLPGAVDLAELARLRLHEADPAGARELLGRMAPGAGLALAGEILAWEGAFGEARSAFRAALARDPLDAAAAAGSMQLELLGGNPAAALEIGHRMGAAAAASSSCCQAMADACSTLGMWGAAEAWLTRALAGDPDPDDGQRRNHELLLSILAHVPGGLYLLDRPLPLPIELTARFTQGIPVIEITIDGHRFDMALDTGASEMVLTIDAAAAVPFAHRVEGATVVGGGGEIDTGFGVLRTIEVAGLRVRNVLCGIVALPLPLHALGVDGVIGPAALFGRERIGIDYGTGRVTIRPSGAPGVGAAPCIVASNLPFVHVAANGGRSWPFLVDSGAAASFVFGEYGEIEGSVESGSDVPATGIGGSRSAGPVARGVRLELTGTTLGPLSVFRRAPLDAAAAARITGFRWGGILGGDAFAGRTLVVDYGARWVSLSPAESSMVGGQAPPSAVE